MSSRARRVEELFHAALDLAVAERARFLTTTCAGDEDLRREVEELLGRDAADDDRLDAPAPELLELARPAVGLLTGRKLGPFRLERLIAAGGMGAVYEALQENPRRAVAVKVLRAEVATPDLERRFRVESAFLARLQHPAIAHVYGADVADLDGLRVPYIAMELVDGARTISEHARASKLELRERVELFALVCDAVHHGHLRGVIHRDLKPANILVDSGGRPKLIDFGVARAVEPDAATHRTEPGVLLGTLAYMSPEQCADARELDVRSDVYSLGVVLYELLCGRLPYELGGAALAQAVRIVLDRPPDRPSASLRALRGDLETILLTALEKDRARRYQSAAELGRDLRCYLRREPIAARAPSWSYRLSLVARRHKALFAALSAVFASSVAAAVVSLRFAWSERRAREREERSAYLANIAAADLALRAHDAAAARGRLASAPEERRGWEWSYLSGQLDLALAVLRGPRLRCEALDWRAGRIASAWHFPEGSALVLFDAGERAEIARLEELESVPTRLSLAPDGAVVFGALDGALRRWDPESGAAEVLDRGHTALITGVHVTESGAVVTSSLDGTVRVWQRGADEPISLGGAEVTAWRDLDVAADGSLLVAGGADGTARVFALPSGRMELVLEASEREVLALALDPAGARLATGASDGSVRVFDVASGAELLRLSGSESEIQDLAFSPGGDLLVAASSDRTLRSFDAASGELRAVLHGHEAPAKCLAFSAGGELVASGAYDGTVRLWDSRAEGGSLRLGEHRGFVRDLVFSPDGRLLATASFDRTANLYDSSTWRQVATLAGHGDRVTAVAFHPAGELVATASNDGRVRLWRAPDWELAETLERHADGVLTLAFSPAGDWLASGSRDGRVLFHASDGAAGAPELAALEHGEEVEQLAVDPTGRHLATASGSGTLRLWEIRSGRELWRRATGCELHDVAFAPRGDLLAAAAGDFDGTDLSILLLDARTGAERGALLGHADVVLGLAFSPDGARLASSSADGTARIWDPLAAEELLVLRGHESWVYCAAFSPDGSWLATGGGTSGGAGIGARVWDGSVRRSPR